MRSGPRFVCRECGDAGIVLYAPVTKSCLRKKQKIQEGGGKGSERAFPAALVFSVIRQVVGEIHEVRKGHTHIVGRAVKAVHGKQELRVLFGKFRFLYGFCVSYSSRTVFVYAV